VSRIVHLSDLHFGTESPAVLAALERAVHALAPDVVVVSGDLTQRARRTEFAAARRFLDALPGRHVVVPGNHDIPLYNPVARALWPFRRYRETFGPTGTAVVEHGALRIVTVNSVRRERHAGGHVTRGRRFAVAAHARAAPPGSVTIVVAHHPLGTTRADGSPVEDRRTLEHWRRSGVRLVLSGHEHRAFLRRGGEGHGRGGARRRLGRRGRTGERVSDAASDDARGELWVLNAGTALSRRLRHARPNSFNVVDVPDGVAGDDERSGDASTIAGAHPRPLTIERHDFDPTTAAFVLGERRRTDAPEAGREPRPAPRP